MSTQRIIVIGAGFAGVKCAKTLSQILPQNKYEIVIFNRENHMVFHPLLAELMAAAVQAKEVAVPIREILSNIQCRREEVLRVNLDNSEVEYEADSGEARTIHYDQLVIACGSEVNLATVPGMSDHAFPFKTISDAVRLQGHIVDQLERADTCESEEIRRWHLTFIVVGGGFSGVEVAGQLNDLIRESRKYYKNIRESDVNVVLVHPGDQILPELSSSMREFAAKQMAQAGVKFKLKSKVISCTKDGARLSNDEFIRGGSIIATAGTTPHALVERMDVRKERGKLLSEPDMSLPQYPNVWAIGDCAAVVNAFDGKLSPPTAQFAERQAKQVSYNIAARLKGDSTSPFLHKPLGMLCSIGNRNAVAEMMGIKISGFPAWFCWRGVYLMKLPTLSQKIKVGVDWALDIILPRALAHIRENRTDSVSRLFFQAGDFIFREGELATEFYMIESGNVEILQPSNGKYEQIAILGSGEFFGEGALLDNRLRQRACRAQTDVELIVLGSKLFTKISSALSPLKSAVALAIQRRTIIWQQLPELKNILDAIPLERHIESSGNGEIQLTSPLNQVVSQMNTNKLDINFVVDENRILIGILTRTDLLRGLEIVAALPSQKRLGLQAKDIILGEPISLVATDTTSQAVSMMREHGFTKLPVIESQTHRALKGYVRIEKILHDVYEHALAK